MIPDDEDFLTPLPVFSGDFPSSVELLFENRPQTAAGTAISGWN
ncbi:MAG: hypothetical protein PHP56_03255 [Smithellaceae bacterium]|nr:hypothetical protein [Smithellaceae bacterium]MDD3258214.1 hypothetical protein [Smithellaceae bacterium]HOG12536.1 hypothetical protein [Smithellaceae bacterium]